MFALGEQSLGYLLFLRDSWQCKTAERDVNPRKLVCQGSFQTARPLGSTGELFADTKNGYRAVPLEELPDAPRRHLSSAMFVIEDVGEFRTWREPQIRADYDDGNSAIERVMNGSAQRQRFNGRDDDTLDAVPDCR